MEYLFVLVAVIFSFATSLGVGSSTLAVINFFVAISDGKIDLTERKMMSVVYIMLRVAMVTLFLTLVMLTAYNTYHLGAAAITALLGAQWLILCVLYANAILMTIKVMPSTFGPAIQAGSWYTLGILAALLPLGLTNFSFGQFIIGYLLVLSLATALINSVISLLSKRRQKLAVNQVATTNN